MYRLSGRAGIAAVALSLVASTAQAAPNCWQDREVSASRVRQMQTMLMVATLRCRAAHLDISDDYNGFMTAQNDAVSAANLVIKQHFAQAGGSQTDYDHFATSLANGYGDDDTSAASCADAAALAHEAMAAKDAGALDRVATARLFPAAIPGGACSAPVAPAVPAPVLAAAAPLAPPKVMLAAAAVPARAAPLPPVLALAAPAPLPAAPAAVALPADVVAALTVMARFHDAQLAAASAATPAGPTQVATIK